MRFPKTKHFFVKMQDIIITDILYIIPSFIRWFYHVGIVKNINVFPLLNQSGKKATLYQHGKWESGQEDAKAILILHGLYGHPSVMLNLAEMAQAAKLGSVFSLYVTYNLKDLNAHRSLIKQALDKIENLFKERNCSLGGIVMVGHSMGAIESAHSAFVEQDRRILSVISIAGKLRNVDSEDVGLLEHLHASFDNIYAGILALPDLPLYQIVGEKDWIASLESTLIRTDQEYFHIIKNAMHLNLLFHQDMHKKFPEFLRKSSKTIDMKKRMKYMTL